MSVILYTMSILGKSGQGQLAASMVTFALVFGSSVLFCSKAVFVKMAYRYGLDPVTVIALRMSLALPFFLAGAFWEARKAKIKLRGREWWQLAGLGFLGWYFSSLVNFEGLKHISVGLERIILYTYPSLILLASTVWLKKRLRPKVVLGMVIAYLGIIISYVAEVSTTGSGNTLYGVAMVFLSAMSYGAFVMLSKGMIQRLGPIRFTSLAVAFSCGFGLIHFALTHSLDTLTQLPSEALGWGFALAILGTVMPAYLFGLGLKRTDAQTFAIIGMAGPIGTVFLGYALLDESLDPLKIFGLLLALGGGLYVSLRPSDPDPAKKAAKR